MSIIVDDLVYVYHQGTPLETEALKGVSMEANPGEWVSVVGHTGSGKSTLAQHLNALLVPTKGKVEVDGILVGDDTREHRKIRQRVGLIFQYPEQQLFEETVFAEVAFGPRNWGVSEEEIPVRVREALQAVGLDESFWERNPFQLSGGEKRRVAIASILSIRPRYLVLDEPTAGLDSKGRDELCSLLRQLKVSGTGIIHVTHDLELALEYSDKILVLESGKALFWGSPEVIVEELIEREIEGLVVPPVVELARRLRDVGFDVPVTWKAQTLASAIEEKFQK
ncbi:cobalt ABC transporter, ATPase subunit [Thermovirga lienii DSM 17291]|jgi:energy-coupling factor transport system ATP-binding protein|uniref:Cobalt ABC transporter, ATPase subunit n=1 Tax=Thermovirga lienii (strain ATCC BAA-1197 / DSM 17291 / Cas60314) TaxID=580340 RepID=G7V944_THELD|nr:energy-coupling factor transporter ATPase [Thermovirga lienii]MDN5318946.1 energy-coupling factor transport system ATP-binding protein [Thermovirga sp.]AER66413.1 cobalt ABC transporter, ATPase subunit [Thermovirga lienii DSM 17291]KUK42577.1 MAG: Cobalt ABC transporter, ATPase subunit [Thermovirga lienii]MDN5368480.1 energy-coupling factor transport system ATP-binding protein [Thermovirga sp.]HCD72450.1 energy-coupling factor ABC transporter ATP-binding protein [Thermovirga lienii]